MNELNECSGLCDCPEDDTIFLVKICAYLRMCISALVLAHRGGFLFTLMFYFLADAILLGIRHINELYCFVKILFNNLFYFV